jgi:RNA polymerase sigma factor (TIGR02999 family)
LCDDCSSFVVGGDTSNRAVLDEMMPKIYAELRKLAQSYMKSERREHTLQPTALVHEAYLRMVDQRTVEWHNRAQLLGIAARMMRRILLDHAAARHAVKRDAERVTLTDVPGLDLAGAVDVLDLDRALRRLSEIDAQQADIVELRFFGGLTNEEISELLGISPTTARRRWSSARLWLALYWKQGGL